MKLWHRTKPEKEKAVNHKKMVGVQYLLGIEPYGGTVDVLCWSFSD
jgi:hypothetical protein